MGAGSASAVVSGLLVEQRTTADAHMGAGSRKVDIRLPGKENSNFHGAKPIY